jgi:nucleoid-associated protein YgaU
MADFNQLRQKYQPVLDVVQKEGARVEALDLQGDQLHLQVVTNSEASKNRIWDAIKAVDPTFADLKHDISVDPNAATTYTVQPGDNLSKISKQFYGDANKYMTIAKANGIADPDKIRAGMELKIPPAA